MADVQFDRRQLLAKAGAIGAALTALAITQGPVGAFADDRSSDSNALADLVRDLEEALESVQQLLEQRVEKLEELLEILQDVLDQLFELISELVESIEEKPLSLQFKFSDLSDLFRVLQEGLLTLIQTILDDIKGIE